MIYQCVNTNLFLYTFCNHGRSSYRPAQVVLNYLTVVLAVNNTTPVFLLYVAGCTHIIYTITVLVHSY